MIDATGVPVKISRMRSPEERGIGLEIAFSTGEQVTLPSATLRRNCPCATCNENRNSAVRQTGSKLRVLQSAPADEIDLQEVWAVGNYALGLRWADRHDSGIYTYELLRELAEGELHRTCKEG